MLLYVTISKNLEKISSYASRCKRAKSINANLQVLEVFYVLKKRLASENTSKLPDVLKKLRISIQQKNIAIEYLTSHRKRFADPLFDYSEIPEMLPIRGLKEIFEKLLPKYGGSTVQIPIPIYDEVPDGVDYSSAIKDMPQYIDNLVEYMESLKSKKRELLKSLKRAEADCKNCPAPI